MKNRPTEIYFAEWMNRVSAERIHLRDDFCQLLAVRDAEIERLHKANKRLDRYCLEYGKAYARLEAKLERAEAVIEAARHHAQDQYATELAEKISTFDKEEPCERLLEQAEMWKKIIVQKDEEIERADKVIDISRYMAIYGATPELWKQLDTALQDYDKERDDD